MRRVTVVLSLTLMLLGSLVVGAPPAAAAPAQPYNQSHCFTENFEGTILEYCFQARGVAQVIESASGNVIYVDNAEFCSQFFVNGGFVDDGCQKVHSTYLRWDDVTQRYHVNIKAESTFESPDGTTYICSSRIKFSYASGAVRHDDVQMECTPQL